MAVTLEEIIVGTSLSDIEHFEEAKEGNISHVMFEDPMLAEIFKDMEKAYKEGRYDKTWMTFDLWELFKEDFPKLLRAVDVSIHGYFPSLKLDYNRECLYTGHGNLTVLKFTDYVKSFVNNYSARCKAKRNRMN